MRPFAAHGMIVWLALLLGVGAARGPVATARDHRRKPVVHTVDDGEAVWDIARAYGVSVKDIRKANPGLDPARVRPGDELRIVGAKRRPSKRRKHRSTRTHQARRAAQSRAEHLGLGTRRAAARLLMGRAEPEWIRAAGRPDRLEGSLRWPVTKGWFVRGFGSGTGGYHQAVDIGGEVGWHVRAAASGIVGYAGNELRGFGNVVIVVHRGGWITLYGHNSRNRVMAGQRVHRGQVLAELGSTGRSRGPHVHFELLFDGENCDPQSLFRPGVRKRNGKLSHVKRHFWNRPSRKPRQIRCHPRKHHPKRAT